MSLESNEFGENQPAHALAVALQLESAINKALARRGGQITLTREELEAAGIEPEQLTETTLKLLEEAYEASRWRRVSIAWESPDSLRCEFEEN